MYNGFHKIEYIRKTTYERSEHNPVIPSRTPRDPESAEKPESNDDGCDSEFSNENSAKHWRMILIASLRRTTRCRHWGELLLDKPVSEKTDSDGDAVILR